MSKVQGLEFQRRKKSRTIRRSKSSIMREGVPLSQFNTKTPRRRVFGLAPGSIPTRSKRTHDWEASFLCVYRLNNNSSLAAFRQLTNTDDGMYSRGVVTQHRPCPCPTHYNTLQELVVPPEDHVATIRHVACKNQHHSAASVCYMYISMCMGEKSSPLQ